MISKVLSLETLVDEYQAAYVLIDRNVYELYEDDLPFSNKIILPAGEECKSHQEYLRCINLLLDMGIRRDSHILAIGGGALSDLAGFVAATVLRGVSWSIVPTTLLSMIDASIGGKVAINGQHGKNQIGSFHFPENIYTYSPFLETLPDEELISGKGEILKYAFLDKSVYKSVLSNSSTDKIISLCQKYKMKIVGHDPFEKGARKFLNFGHTIGHVIEFEKKYSHGLSVACGIKYILERFRDDRLLDEYERLTSCLGIILPDGFSDLTFESLKYDKKSEENKKISLIRVKKIGRPFIEKVALEELSG